MLNTACDFPLIILVGPTAVGKTDLSLGLAERFSGEIVGVDSMQIYKYMDIGTAKPTIEERARVPHHLVDFVDPAENYNLSRFVKDAKETVANLNKKNRLPIMVGGTGLYVRGYLEGVFQLPEIPLAVKEILAEQLFTIGLDGMYDDLQSIDPITAARVDRNDKYRIIRALEIYRATGKTWASYLEEQNAAKKRSPKSILPLKIGLTIDRDLLYERINKRVKLMVEQGLLGEVENLLAMGYSSTLKSMQSLGYRHMINYINGVWGWEETLDLLARDTRRYAKRQLTWFRKDTDITWVSPSDHEEVLGMAGNYLARYNSILKDKPEKLH